MWLYKLIKVCKNYAEKIVENLICEKCGKEKLNGKFNAEKRKKRNFLIREAEKNIKKKNFLCLEKIIFIAVNFSELSARFARNWTGKIGKKWKQAEKKFYKIVKIKKNISEKLQEKLNNGLVRKKR